MPDFPQVPGGMNVPSGRGQELPPGLRRQPSGPPFDRLEEQQHPQAVTQQDKYAPTSWGGEITEDVRLPSGQLCLARRIGIEGLLKAGIVHDIDPLMGFVREHEERVKGKKPVSEEASMMEVLKDSGKIDTLLHMLDKIIVSVVVKPRVEMAPNDITKRVAGVVYTDTVQMEDKLFLMQWAMGGVEKLAQFREEFEKSLGSVSAEQADGDSTE